MRKKILVSVYLLTIFLTAACSKDQEFMTAPIPVTIAPAVQCSVPIYSDYVGHIEAYKTVQIFSQIEGVLKNQLFVEGQNVLQGDLLYVIDPRPYQAALQKAEAALSRTIAELKYDEDTVRRYGQLIQDDYVSQLDFEKYVTTVMADQASMKQNLADIETAKLNLEYCYIHAPMDAVAGSVKINVGNLVQNDTTKPLVSLNQICPIYASFFIPEKDFPRIQELQINAPLPAKVFLNQNYSRPFEGILTMIDNQVDENTGMILLKATLANTDQRLWPGEFVDVRLVLGEEKDAVLIPAQAVQIGQNGNYVFVMGQEQKVELRNVRIGQKYENYLHILEGIKPDERVVLDGQINLYDGAHVVEKKLQFNEIPSDRGPQ